MKRKIRLAVFALLLSLSLETVNISAASHMSFNNMQVHMDEKHEHDKDNHEQYNFSSKVKLNKTKETIYIGGTSKNTIKLNVSKGSSKTIKWESDNPSVATVDKNGKVTSVSVGTANIIATSKYGSALCEITVKETSISLNEDNIQLNKNWENNKFKLIATIEGANNKITWHSSDKKIATVDGSGKVTAKGTGTTTITATANGVSASCKVTVIGNYVKINSEDLELFSGETKTIKANIDKKGKEIIKWTSSDETVVTIDSKGKIKAIDEGIAIITATYRDTSDTIKISVQKPSFSIEDDVIYLKTYSKENKYDLDNLEVNIVGRQNKITWTIDKKYKNFISKNKKNEIIAKKEGEVVITGTVNGISDTILIIIDNDYDKTESNPNDNIVTPECTTHDYKAEITMPICLQQGYTIYTCECGDSYVADYVNALGHNWSNWTVVVESTEEATGLEERSCSVCNTKETKEIPMKDHVHNYISTIVEPTCTERGYTTYTCKCEDSYMANYVDELGHVWGEWIITKEATEEETGTEERICSVCCEVEKNIIPKKEHTHEYKTLLTRPTCVEAGYTTYTCECGDNYKDNYVEPLGHAYEELTINPTCVEAGYTTYVCICGDSYIDNKVDALGHTWSDWTVVVESTEEATGLEERNCSVCNTKETKEIPMKDHTHNYVSKVVEPTCTEAGYTKYTCKCGNNYVADYVDAFGHDWSGWTVIVESTEETTGLEERNCNVCNTKETKEIPMKEHTHNYISNVVEPTCTEVGYTTYTCKCGDNYVDNKVDALGHDYKKSTVDPTCIETGYTEYVCECGDNYIADYVDALGHNWSNWIVVVESTEEATGLEERSCSVCNTKETKEIPMKDHTHNYISTIVEPTCTEIGYTTYTCKCGDSYTADYVDALGHVWSEWIVTKEATEETTGIEKRYCESCDSEETSIIPEKEHEHNYSNLAVINPTCTEVGYTTYTCKCGDSYTADYVDALGHNYTSVTTEATCIEQGYTIYTCECGYSYIDDYVDINENAHIVGEWIITLEPTYIETGIKTKSCTVCNKVIETEEIPVLELTNGDAIYTIQLADGKTDYVVGHYDTELAADLMYLVNTYRLENGLTELTVTDYLQDKANIRGYQTSYLWEHKTPMGTSPTAAYDYASENLAWYITRTSALEIFNALKNSESHENIMLSNYTYNNTAVSVFCKRVAENDYEYYWVQIFD